MFYPCPLIMMLIFNSFMTLLQFNPQTAGVPYTEQNHLHRQRREFHIQNSAQKMKENDVKTILFSLAYLTLIKLPFCMSTGKRDFSKKKKKKKKNWGWFLSFYKLQTQDTCGTHKFANMGKKLKKKSSILYNIGLPPQS